MCTYFQTLPSQPHKYRISKKYLTIARREVEHHKDRLRTALLNEASAGRDLPPNVPVFRLYESTRAAMFFVRGLQHTSSSAKSR